MNILYTAWDFHPATTNKNSKQQLVFQSSVSMLSVLPSGIVLLALSTFWFIYQAFKWLLLMRHLYLDQYLRCDEIGRLKYDSNDSNEH